MSRIVTKAAVCGLGIFFAVLGPRAGRRVGAVLQRGESFPPLRSMLSGHFRRRPVDARIISFPKCGRTWLRLMLGKAIREHFSLSSADILRKTLELESLAELHPAVPKVTLMHEDSPHYKKPDELERSNEHFRNSKVILLVRDPRDVVVSAFFEKSKRAGVWYEDLKQQPAMAPYVDRLKPYEGDISTFLRDEVGSLETIIRYYNIWAGNRDVSKAFLLVRYEDMHANPTRELGRVLDFLGLHSVPSRIVEEATAFASFKNMREMESGNAFDSPMLRPVTQGDPDSYKTRKGKVGGFRDYFTAEDIAYADAALRDRLSPLYGYGA